ncbi:MAG: hypothetical protein OXR84_04515 [Magnetovibrio sp.]|nr:hypothetical protein [Magnetovibrio sp.]
MQPFSKHFADFTAWSAIGEFIDGIRVGRDVGPVPLDYVDAGHPGRAPKAAVALFQSVDKVIGPPAELFPHAQRLDTGRAAADPAVKRWLEMLDRLRPFNVKGQIAGAHRYLAGVGDLAPIIQVARSLPWAGPVTRAQRNDESADAALVRYVSLRHLGIHSDRLRIVWLADELNDTDWVVTSILLGGQWLVLDHFHGDIAGDEVYLDAHPYFSLNAEHCWLHWRGGDDAGAEGALARLSRQLRFGRA